MTMLVTMLVMMGQGTHPEDPLRPSLDPLTMPQDMFYNWLLTFLTAFGRAEIACLVNCRALTARSRQVPQP